MPQSVVMCHCQDCRRSTGGPVSAFAAFDENTVMFAPNEGRSVNANPGATRTFCPDCGSPLTGRYDYLPGQIYIPLGVIDQADQLPATLHSHYGECLPWLNIVDDVEKSETSGRDKLNNPSA